VGAAQLRFDALVKNSWGPRLRALGFTGSGRTWTLPDRSDWAMLGFQTSQASTAEESKFTMNLLVVGKSEWAAQREVNAWMSAKPSPNVRSLARYQERIGALMKGNDHWWRLAGDGSNERSLDNEILRVLEDLVAPALRREMRSQG